MIHGACAGAGSGLALACDLRFAAQGARLGITPARIGAAYPFADTKALVDLVGPARAKHILFSGALIDAPQAQAIGLVDFVHPEATLAAEVTAYAQGLAALSQNSIRTAKAMIAAIEAGAASETPELEALFAAAFAHPDFAEGYSAFLAKRKPRFPSS